MSKKSLEQLKAAFTQPKQSSNTSWKNFYPFWKMETGEQAVVRFLPDLNEENPMGFIVENLTHKLTINGQTKTVPCLSMYGEPCPCCDEAQKHFNEGNEDLGRKYYKKREYIGQIIIRETPFEVDAEPVVKLISLGPKIFKLIQASFASGDLDEAPYELIGGYDFRLVKSQQGQWADYGLSKFSPRQSNVDEDLIAKMDLFNLTDQRTPKIDHAAMEAMLLADKTGQSYSNAPADDNGDQAVGTAAAAAKPATPAAAETAPSAPVEQAEDTAAPAGNSKANDILAQIRARAAAKQAS